MEYLYTEKQDFSFLASGNIIKHFSGMPCFPVRLNIELFERAYRLINKDKINIYDPCCGSAFSLTVLGMMCQPKINCLYGSDINENCIEAARCNMSLIKKEGLLKSTNKFLSEKSATPQRRIELEKSIEKLMPYLVNPEIRFDIFSHDILVNSPDINEKIDYVFADIPYGTMTDWESDEFLSDKPVDSLLHNIVPILNNNSIVTICGTKDIKIKSDIFRRVCKIKAGKRLIYMLQLI